MGFLGAALTIIFIIIFTEIFGKDPITLFKDSSMTIKVIMILLLLLFTSILLRKEYK
jgi:hypothetical protein